MCSIPIDVMFVIRMVSCIPESLISILWMPADCHGTCAKQHQSTHQQIQTTVASWCNTQKSICENHICFYTQGGWSYCRSCYQDRRPILVYIRRSLFLFATGKVSSGRKLHFQNPRRSNPSIVRPTARLTNKFSQVARASG